MKKVKTKKKTGSTEAETNPAETNGPEREKALSATAKAKVKVNQKKAITKEETAEGVAAKLLGKNQWLLQVRDFFREVRIELKKVTWPTRKETIAATSMVIILSVLVAFFLGLLDVGLAKAVGVILRRS
jgi:preprotein translocase subunit SecE